MKLIYTLLLSAFLGCTKEEKICWECDLSNLPPSSATHPDKFEVCQAERPTSWSDGQGNNWGGFPCHQK